MLSSASGSCATFTRVYVHVDHLAFAYSFRPQVAEKQTSMLRGQATHTLGSSRLIHSEGSGGNLGSCPSDSGILCADPKKLFASCISEYTTSYCSLPQAACCWKQTCLLGAEPFMATRCREVKVLVLSSTPQTLGSGCLDIFSGGLGRNRKPHPPRFRHPCTRCR